MSAAAFPARAFSGIKSLNPIWVLLIILWVWIAVKSPNFATPDGFLAYIKRAAPLLLLAMGQFFVIVSGEFDLSVGSIVGAMVIGAAFLTDGDPANTVWVIPALLVFAMFVGLVNGLVTTKLRVPSFITTLGTMLILHGVIFLWTKGSPKGSLPENLRVLGRGQIDDVPGIGSIPYSFLALVALGAIAIWLVRGNFGRKVLAVGDNERAASLSGISVPRVRTMVFIISGLAAGIAGIILTGVGSLSADAGAGYEFQAITAVVLGGAVLGGGRGTIGGAIAGALTLEALFKLINLLGVASEYQYAVQGLIIIIAVSVASYRMRA